MEILCGGFGGPKERVYAAIDGFPGCFGKGDCIYRGVEGGFGIGVAEGPARSVRILKSLFTTEDLKDDAPGRMEAAWWEPSWRPRRGNQRFPFRFWLSAWWWSAFAPFSYITVTDAPPAQRWRSDQKSILLPLPLAFWHPKQPLQFLPRSSWIAAIAHVTIIHPRRHVENGRGVRPVLSEVENDVDDFVWQITRQRQILAEGDDGSH